MKIIQNCDWHNVNNYKMLEKEHVVFKIDDIFIGPKKGIYKCTYVDFPTNIIFGVKIFDSFFKNVKGKVEERFFIDDCEKINETFIIKKANEYQDIINNLKDLINEEY